MARAFRVPWMPSDDFKYIVPQLAAAKRTASPNYGSAPGTPDTQRLSHESDRVRRLVTQSHAVCCLTSSHQRAALNTPHVFVAMICAAK